MGIVQQNGQASSWTSPSAWRYKAGPHLRNQEFSPGTHDLSNTCGQKDLDLRNEKPGFKYFDMLYDLRMRTTPQAKNHNPLSHSVVRECEKHEQEHEEGTWKEHKLTGTFPYFHSAE